MNNYKYDLPTEKFKKIWKKSFIEMGTTPVWIHGDIAHGNLLVGGWAL